MSLLQEQARALGRLGMKKYLKVLPMYAGLPYTDQMKVFERTPPTVRKVNFNLPLFRPNVPTQWSSTLINGMLN